MSPIKSPESKMCYNSVKICILQCFALLQSLNEINVSLQKLLCRKKKCDADTDSKDEDDNDETDRDMIPICLLC